MGIKKKVFIILTIMFVILLILPIVFIKLSKPHEFMGIMLLLFFIINPITIAVINLMIGKEIKKLWWISILFCIVFLLSYWLVLEEIILDLIFYVGIYLIIGFVFMFISLFVIKKIKLDK